MQCGTMLIKNLVWHLGVHDKMDHTLEVRLLSLGEIIGRPVRVTPSCENTPTIWDQYMLRGALKPGVFTPKV